MKRNVLSLALITGLMLGANAQADTLLVQRAQAEQRANLPARGASMAQVQARFGAPQQKLAPIAGPGTRKHNPPITRWMYPNFNVFFEYNHVVDAVMIQSKPEEIGPAPANR